jgi:hypothetical protein
MGKGNYQIAGFSAPRFSSTTQSGAVGEMERRGNLIQRPQHKTAVFHIVVRYRQALAVNHRIAKQHDIEIQRAGAPAFGFALTALLQLDALGMIQQASACSSVSRATAALR